MEPEKKLKCCLTCEFEKPFKEFKFSKSKNRYLPSCVACEKEYKRVWWLKSKERVSSKRKEYYTEYYEANKDEINRKARSRYSNNKGKEALRKKVYYAANREIVISRNKTYQSKPENSNRANFLKRERRKNDPTLRISDSVSAQIRQQIKNKNQRTVFSILGYSLKDLMNHLEAQFKSNMTWENYGTLWHIDHIIPISWFKFETTDDAEFEKCWSLSNLQPLLASINLSKGNRYAG
jgi:hypothetical protein